MSEELNAISDADVARLRRLLAAFESGRLGRATPPPPQRLPGPKWTQLGKVTVEVTAADGVSNLGAGTVAVWRASDDGTHYEDTGDTADVINPTTSAFAVDSWVELFRDPWTGQYWAQPWGGAGMTFPYYSTLFDGPFGTSHDFTFNLAAGDVVLFFLYSGAASTITPPGDVNTLYSGQVGGAGIGYFIGWRRMEADSETYTFGTGASTSLTNLTIAIRRSGDPVAAGDDGTTSTHPWSPVAAPGGGIPDGSLVSYYGIADGVVDMHLPQCCGLRYTGVSRIAAGRPADHRYLYPVTVASGRIEQELAPDIASSVAWQTFAVVIPPE